jgi:sortase A
VSHVEDVTRELPVVADPIPRQQQSPELARVPAVLRGAPASDRSVARWAVIALAVIGGFLATFIAYEWWFTGVLQGRSQAALLSEFRTSLVLDDTPSLVTPPEGHPVGLMEFRILGVEQMIVQGISSEDTKLGPGHDPSTPAPGQAGNAVVIGRRSTYGAPFGNLSQLRIDDPITVTTRQWQFTYKVVSKQTKPLGDVGVTEATKDDRLTLITADSGLHPTRELVVTARLDGEGLQAPGPLPLRPSGQRPGSTPDASGGWALIALEGQLLVLTAAAAAYLYGRGWNPAVVYLLTVPLLIALAILFYGAVDPLLPPVL